MWGDVECFERVSVQHEAIFFVDILNVDIRDNCMSWDK